MWFQTPTLKGFPYDPSLVLWYSAESINGYRSTLPSDGTLIPMAYDLSGNNNHAVNSNSSTQPTFSTGIQNGRPGIFSIDAFRYLANTSPKNFRTDAISCFTVIRPNTGSTNRIPLRITSTTGGETCICLLQGTTTARWAQPSSATGSPGPNVAYSWVSGANYIMEGHGDATNGTIVILNGSVLGTSSNGGFNMTTPTITIGNSGTTGNASMQNYWFELLYYKRMLNSTERATVRAYLNAKWAVY